MAIVHTRIDDRLIHDRAAAEWTEFLGVTRVVVPDDEASRDDVIKISLKISIPSGINLSVLPIDYAAERILGGCYGEQRLMMILKSPRTLVALLARGICLGHVNVGNLRGGERKTRITDAIHASSEELNDFEWLSRNGVSIVIQRFPSDEKRSLSDLVKERSMGTSKT
jgi:PTS system mannose-specific IIB component